MHGVLALLCLALGLIATYATVAVLGLALTPQDSGVPATGDWGYAVVPAGLAVGAFSAAIALLRPRRDSR